MGFAAAAPIIATVGEFGTAAAITSSTVMATSAGVGLASSAGFGATSIFAGVTASGVATGLSAGSSLLSGFMGMQSNNFQKAQYEANAGRSRVQALQLEAEAIRRAKRMRSSAIAQGAANGIDVSSSRSFLAFLDEEKRAEQRDITNIRANGQIGVNTNRLAAAGSSAAATGSVVSGVVGAGRSLLEHYAEA